MSSESTPRSASATAPAQQIAAGYAVEGQALELGTVVVDGTADPTAQIRIPLATVNRHGLVAGRDRHRQDQDAAGDRRAAVRGGRARADGRRQGRPVRPVAARREQRQDHRACQGNRRHGRRAPFRWTFCRWAPKASVYRCAPPSPASDPSCCQRCLGLNSTQESTLGLIFHCAEQQDYELLDLKDLRAVISKLTGDEGKADLKVAWRRFRANGRRHPACPGQSGSRRRRHLFRRARTKTQGPLAF